ncbi:MAG: hypothetical protein GY811_20860 [Myxococcales bacterium]|nr:hypothetical protein [Myxococcales bacterium]
MLRNSRTLCALLALPLLGLGCGKDAEPAEKSTSGQKAPTETAKPSTDKAPIESAKLAAPAKALPVADLPADEGEHGGALRFAVSHGSTDTDAARALAIDANGDYLVAGYFKGDGIFGKDYTTEDISAYLAKLNKADGSVAWSLALGGAGTNSAEALAVGADGSTIVVGSFSGELAIGNGTLTSAGADDMFITKIAADGHRLWAKRIGAKNIEAADAVSIDEAGNSYITGIFRSKVKFGELEVTSSGDSDIFLTKLSPAGEFLWTKTFGSMGQDFGRHLGIDSAGNVILLAEISLMVGFGGEDLTTNGNRDIALVKFTSEGEHLWSKSLGSIYDDFGIRLDIDPADNILMTGSFEGSVNFGGEDLKARGRSDMYVAKFDTNGQHVWSQSFGGKDKDWGNSIATDAHGNAYVTGWFWYDVDFGDTKLNSKGKEDVFVLKLSPSGSVLWAKSYGNTSRDMGKAVAVDSEGGLVSVGSYNVSIDFGAGELKPTPGVDAKMLKGDFFLSSFER